MSIEQELVSIVVTTYNGEKYLAQQLDSILAQTWKNLEVIIADDRSTDSTPAIVEHYAALDSRINFYRNEKNLGLHANLEKALKLSKGTYIAISDQDDIWKLDKIEKLMGSIGKHAAIFSDSELIGGDGALLGSTVMQSIRVEDLENCTKPLSLLSKNVVSGHAMLFHRAILDAVLPFTDDLIFDHQIAIAASVYGGLAFYPDPLVLHRIHGGNHTNKNITSQSSGSDSGENKLVRRSRYRAVLLSKIQYLMMCCNARSVTLGEFEIGLDRELIDSLSEIAESLRGIDDGFFCVKSFLLLLRVGREHPYHTAFRLKRCFTLAKGAKWYRLAAKFGAR